MSGSESALRIDYAVGIFALLAVGSCASPRGPPGGPPDLSGPQVVATVPDTFALIEAFDGPIRITFNERISERGASGSLDQAVQVSPESGEIEVRHRKDGLEVRMEGGFLTDLVYRVTVLPTVQDLFRNAMPQPFEFIFSTGAEIVPNALAGMVFDRLTSEPMEGVRVAARFQPLVVGGIGEAQGPTHVAISDTSGVFAFRYLPPVGRYVLTAFQDVNRNREADFFEPVGDAFQVINGADTVFTDITLLRPDTTAAIVSDAEAVDSVTVTVEFDDYLDPDAPLTGVLATLQLDSLPAGVGVREIMQEREYLIRTKALEDSLRVADSLRILESIRVADSLRAAGDSVAATEVDEARPRPRPAPPVDRPEEETRDLPKRTIYLLLSDTLIAEETYELSVSGVTNINGVAGGGGTAEIVRAAPPVDSVAIADSILAADSAAAALDTISQDTIRPDTIRPDAIRPDTIRPDAIRPDMIRPDTIRPDMIRPDTIPRDTITRDTTGVGPAGATLRRDSQAGATLERGVRAGGTPLSTRRRLWSKRELPPWR